jgi:hypothetical protein
MNLRRHFVWQFVEEINKDQIKFLHFNQEFISEFQKTHNLSFKIYIFNDKSKLNLSLKKTLFKFKGVLKRFKSKVLEFSHSDDCVAEN